MSLTPLLLSIILSTAPVRAVKVSSVSASEQEDVVINVRTAAADWTIQIMS